MVIRDNNHYFFSIDIRLACLILLNIFTTLEVMGKSDKVTLQQSSSEKDGPLLSEKLLWELDSSLTKQLLTVNPELLDTIAKDFQNSPQKSIYILSLHHLGLHYFERPNFEEAKAVFKTILAQGEEKRDWEEMANAYNLLSNMAELDNQFVEMYFLNKKLMELGEKYHPKLKAMAHLNFGIFYSELQDWESAEERFKIGLSIYEQLPNNFSEYGWLLHRLGELYKLTHRYENAEIHLSKAMDYWEKINDNRGKRFTNLQLAEVYLDLGEIGRAREVFQKVWQNCKINSYYLCQVITSISLGELEFNQGKFHTAIRYLEDGIALRMEKANTYNLKESYELLAKTYQAIGDLKKSNQNYGLYLKEVEKIEQEKNINAQKMAENQDDLSNKEAAYQLLKQSEEINQKKLNTQKIIILKILLFTFCIGWVAYANYKSSKRNYAQKKELAQLNTKIQEQADILKIANEQISNRKKEVDLELVKKMLLLSQQVKAIDELKVLVDKMPSTQATLKMEKIIKESENKSIWDELNVQLTQSNSELFSKLSKQFDNLSQNDLRLCALLKMNLRTKEIANLTFKNPQSVKVARSRLRKKLGLTHSNLDLSTFLNQI